MEIGADDEVAFWAGDPEAFVEVVANYELRLLRTAYSILRDTALAEDVVADAFLALHRHATDMYQGTSVLPWLTRVVVNRAITVARRRDRDRRVARALRWSQGPGLDPEAIAVTRDLRSRVLQAVSGLPVNERAVVVLHYFIDQDVETMALTLDCPVGTIKSRLFRAREHLRRHLDLDAISLMTVPGEA